MELMQHSMIQTTPNSKQIYLELIETDDDDELDPIELEEGFIELEGDEDDEDGEVEWLWEEEMEPEVDGPHGPIKIIRGRYVDLL